MQISDEILSGFINCQYKAYLISENKAGSISEYQILYNQLKQKHKANFEKNISKNETLVSSNSVFDNIISTAGIALNLKFTNANIDLTLDGIELKGKKSSIPIFITPFEKITKTDKLFLALQVTLIQNEFSLQIENCKIVSGTNLKQTKFKFSSFAKPIKKLMSEMNKLLFNSKPPVFFRNSHCQVCEFQKSCLEKLIERDDLSLLSGMSKKEIEQKNNKGLFSVKQLSYTFRPKKKLNRRRKFLPELKAYALRENKTFIQDLPIFKEVTTELYLDFEGLPDRSFNYLIGLIVKDENQEKEYSFWAENKSEEIKMFVDLLDVIDKIDDYAIYHFGAYEIQVLKRISKNLPDKYQEVIKTVINKSFNILNIFANNVYPPTYSNSLKEIARYLSFNWTEADASGLQSIVWRYQWESTADKDVKAKLITYNIEDCRALLIIKDWVALIPKNDDDNIRKTENIKIDSIRKWGKVNFQIKQLENINSCAYFNYQRDKVFVKTYPEIAKQQKKSRQKKHSKKLIPNKIIEPERPKICRKCKGNKFLKHDKQQHTVIDLKIGKTCIKRHIILFHNDRYRCTHCRTIHNPENFIRGNSKYGWDLQCWIINQNIQYRISFKKIGLLLKETFDIDFPNVGVQIRSKFSLFYKTTFKEIFDQIKRSALIHIDETTFHIGNEVAYVWVFTNINTVYYLFKPTREAEFLKELLSEFKGVLISDFYAGYDALTCPKQRCLIHLIRNLNDDLVKNQLNVEFQVMVNNFSKLLNEIILTVNKFGLKKRHLNKHHKIVDLFFSQLKVIEFETNICETWRKKFLSYQNELFTFLNYDGVPWNNNNAEAAIKAVALYRRDVDGLPTPNSIQEYLVLLSIQQTCRYRGINYFKFLQSAKTTLSNYSEEPRKNAPLLNVETGFEPS